MKENIILITNRDRVINSINLLSKSKINNFERFKDTARETKHKM